MNFFRNLALAAVLTLPVLAQAAPRASAPVAQKPILVTFGSTGHGSGQRFFAGAKPAAASPEMASLKNNGGPKLISIGSTGTGKGQRFVDTVSSLK